MSPRTRAVTVAGSVLALATMALVLRLGSGTGVQSAPGTPAGAFTPVEAAPDAIWRSVSQTDVDRYTRVIQEWVERVEGVPFEDRHDIERPDGLGEAQQALYSLYQMTTLPREQWRADMPDLEPLLTVAFGRWREAFLLVSRLGPLVELLPTPEARSRVTLVRILNGYAALGPPGDLERLLEPEVICLFDAAWSWDPADNRALAIPTAVAMLHRPTSAEVLRRARAAVVTELADVHSDANPRTLLGEFEQLDYLIAYVEADSVPQLLALAESEDPRRIQRAYLPLERLMQLGAREEARQALLGFRQRYLDLLPELIERARKESDVPPRELTPERARQSAGYFLWQHKRWGIDRGILNEDDWPSVPDENPFPEPEI